MCLRLTGPCTLAWRLLNRQKVSDSHVPVNRSESFLTAKRRKVEDCYQSRDESREQRDNRDFSGVYINLKFDKKRASRNIPTGLVSTWFNA